MRESAVLRRAVPSLVTLLTGVFLAAWTLALPTVIDVWWPWPAPVAGARAGTVALVWGMVLQPVVVLRLRVGSPWRGSLPQWRLGRP